MREEKITGIERGREDRKKRKVNGENTTPKDPSALFSPPRRVAPFCGALLLLLLPAALLFFVFSMAVAAGIKYGTSRVARDLADRGVKKVAVGINCEADALWWWADEKSPEE